MGVDPRKTTVPLHPVTLELLDPKSAAVASQFVDDLVSNGTTVIAFQPVKVSPGERYPIRVVNESADVIAYT
jgi:hypothetical protein